jgi:hypothetical protein
MYSAHQQKVQRCMAEFPWCYDNIWCCRSITLTLCLFCLTLILAAIEISMCDIPAERIILTFSVIKQQMELSVWQHWTSLPAGNNDGMVAGWSNIGTLTRSWLRRCETNTGQRILLGKLIVTHILKFITAFTTALYRNLRWSRWIQYTYHAVFP